MFLITETFDYVGCIERFYVIYYVAFNLRLFLEVKINYIFKEILESLSHENIL